MLVRIDLHELKIEVLLGVANSKFFNISVSTFVIDVVLSNPSFHVSIHETR